MPPGKLPTQSHQYCHEKLDLMTIARAGDADIFERYCNVLVGVETNGDAIILDGAIPSEPQQCAMKVFGGS